MSLTASIALAVTLALNGASGATAPAQMPSAQTIQQYVEIYFADTPVMIDIAKCESRYRQFGTDGSVFRGVVNTKDVGVMQINEFYHGKTADKLGLDLYSIQGNVAYARYLYNKEGTAPWASSSPCWDKIAGKIARK